MRRFINTILAIVTAFIAGIMTLSIVELVTDYASKRVEYHIGGEVLILPLMAILLYIGYLIAKFYFYFIASERFYKQGYKDAKSGKNPRE